MIDPEKKLEQAKDQFQEKQLKPVEVLKTEEGDAAFAKAEQIGAIGKETLDKIKSSLGKNPDSAALKAAFAQIGTPLLLKDVDEKKLDIDAKTTVMDRLKKVLKFPITETKLKDRSELKAALARLRLHAASKGLGTIPLVIEQAFGADAKKHEAAKETVKKAKTEQKQFNDAREYFTSDTTETKLDEAVGRLTSLTEVKKNETGVVETDEVLKNTPLATAIARLNEEISERRSSRDNSTARSGHVLKDDERKKITKEITDLATEISKLTALQEAAKALHSLLETQVKHIEYLFKLKLIKTETEAEKEKEKNFKNIANILSGSKPGDPNFTVKKLMDINTDLVAYRKPVSEDEFNKKATESNSKVSEAEREFTVLDSQKKGLKNLTDAQAAKKIITVMLNEQFPDMSLEDQQKVATLILAEDVATIQSADKYEEFAKKANADVLNVAKDSAAREKLIGMRFKVDGKFVQPFKGFKPKDLADWNSIEKLFKIGKLNHQNGFLAYAALKNMEHPDVPSIQTIKMEKKLKELLADELGVKERMEEAGISRIIDKAFEEQLEKITPLVTDFSAKYNEKRGEWGTFKTQEFKNKFKALAEERRLGKMSDEIYQKRYNELSEEASEAGVGDRFGLSQNAALASFYHNKYMQWGRDRGVDAGRWAKEKAKGLGMSGLRIGWRAGWGATKLGVNLGWQAALTPFRLLKYPFKLLGQPLRLFMKKPWAPLEIGSSVRNDVGRLLGYSKGIGKGVWEGTKGAAGVIPDEWKKRTTKMMKYSERTKVNTETLKKEAEELQLKADEEVAVEVASIPYVKLDKYKTQIEQLNKIISSGGSAEAAAA